MREKALESLRRYRDVYEGDLSSKEISLLHQLIFSLTPKEEKRLEIERGLREKNERTKDLVTVHNRNLLEEDISFTIYTDGSALKNPGPGGYAAYIENIGYIASGRKKQTTNNEMELIAIREALLWATDVERGINEVTIVSDSLWALNAASGGWKIKTHQGLVREVQALVGRLKVNFKWVKGHAGTLGNEKADEEANNQATLAYQSLTTS